MIADTNTADAPNFSLAQDVAPEIKSIDVHPVLLLGQRAPTVIEPDWHHRFGLSTEGAYWVKSEPNSLLVVLNFETTIDAGPNDESRTPLGRFVLGYQVVYVLTKTLSSWHDDALEALAAHYGMNHVWPYFRADLQMLTVKMGLAPLTMPILKIGKLPPGFTISQGPPTGVEASQK